MKDLKTLAIEAALKQDWETAIKANQDLLKTNPRDVETLNRIAFAQMEKGDIPKAKTNYQKILHLDPFNPIALRNLNKLLSVRPRAFKKLKAQSVIRETTSTDLANLFLEEIGKTKITKLKNLAESHIISGFKPGDEVILVVKRRSIFVLDKNNTYLGALSDDLTHRLIQFIKYGNKYQAFIKSVEKNSLTIFIKEVERSPKFKNQSSFTNTPFVYLSSVRDEVLENEEKPQMATLEELEEEKEEDEKEKEKEEQEEEPS